MTFANNLDLDEDPQNVGSHLGSKLFDTEIKYQKYFVWIMVSKNVHGNGELLQILKDFFFI